LFQHSGSQDCYFSPEITFIENDPSRPDVVPVPFPLTTIPAPAIGAPLDFAIIFPESVRSCENAKPIKSRQSPALNTSYSEFLSDRLVLILSVFLHLLISKE